MKDPIKMFRDIEVEHQRNRVGVIAIFAACVIICGMAFFFATNMVKEATNKVYIMENGKALLAAYKTNAEDNRPAEIRDHTKRLLSLLFTISPDKTQIDQNIRDVLYLGDSSVSAVISNMKEARYYDRMIAASASSKLIFDSSFNIKIDYSVYPYRVDVKCKNFIIRTSTVEERVLTCSMTLLNIARSDNNSHGLLAENFLVNSEVENTINRQ